MDARIRYSARDTANSELFALRRYERQAAADERELERRLSAFAARVEEVETLIDEEFRRQHWGREPPRHLVRRGRG
jgi:hypothetical protein